MKTIPHSVHSLFVLMVWLLTRPCIAADVAPMIIKLSSTTNAYTATYTVPSNKVLVVRDIQSSQSKAKVLMEKDGAKIRLGYGGMEYGNNSRMDHDEKGIRFPSGWRLAAETNTIPSEIHLLGDLVSPAVLYGGEPVIIDLRSSTNSYISTFTVPSGKYLVLRQAQLDVTGTLVVSNGVDSFAFVLNSDQQMESFSNYFAVSLWSFGTTFPASWTVAAKKPQSGQSRICLFASLATQADLLAAVPSRFESVVVDGSSMIASLLFTSRNPAAVTLEQSNDLSAWSPCELASRSMTNRTGSLLTWRMMGSDRAFYRSRVLQY